ncbi:MAG TPA: hypothetical protein VEY67_09250 [Candidatus Dormibacteraeota bacterium]|nr:hypothetical protein [Candidatus Dormibacteraeota bacterium]
MTSISNVTSDPRPNVLRGQTVPNTLGELGPFVATTGRRSRPLALVAAGSLILTALALALALGHVA